MKEHLFDRFWRGHGTNLRGAGLGLAIVKGILDAHGTEVEVETEVGRGSTFSFTLPTVA
jgi:signal transduction histidine kinase